MSKRSQYTDVIIDDEGNALNNISVSVYRNGTSSLATIYSNKAGGGKGNPFTTDTDGLIQFWSNPGSYDIVLSDTQNPKRVQDRTITFESISGDDKGVDGDQLEDDAIDSDHLQTDSVGKPEIQNDAVQSEETKSIWPWTTLFSASFTPDGGISPSAGVEYFLPLGGAGVSSTIDVGTENNAAAIYRAIHPGPFGSGVLNGAGVELRLNGLVVFDLNATGRTDLIWTYRLREITPDTVPSGSAALGSQIGSSLALTVVSPGNWFSGSSSGFTSSAVDIFWALTYSSSVTLSTAGPIGSFCEVQFRPVG